MKPRIRKRGNSWYCGDMNCCGIGATAEEAYWFWFHMRTNY